MDDKWFIYYEGPWLSLHRSWTGYCIFKVRFDPVNDGMQIVEALMNRDPAQHQSQSESQDTALLSILLDARAKRDVRERMKQHIRPRQPSPPDGTSSSEEIP